MISDLCVQKDTLSSGNVTFSFKLKNSKLCFKNPRSPPWTFFFRFFIFLLKTFTYSSNYPSVKKMGPEFLIVK